MTIAEPTLSVVINNYNYGRFLGRAIDSAIEQGDRIEVIVVDDGSGDGSLDIARTYGTRIITVAKHNGGQASALNAGIAAASGDLLMMLDADDFLLPGAAERICAQAKQSPDAVMFLHPLRLVDGSGAVSAGCLPEAGRSLPQGDLRDRLLSAPDDIPWQPTSGLTVRASAVSRILPIPEAGFRTCADVYLVNTLPLMGPVASLPEPGAAYRLHGANAHYRTAMDLQRLRETIRRTEVTHAEIRRLAEEFGIVTDGSALELRSVTDLASRLIISRLETDGTAERRRDLLAEGLRASLSRPETTLRRRTAMAGWFMVCAVAPACTLERLAALALTR